MATNYSRGANFERTVRDFFRTRGYVVIRAAGSHGPADLACLREGSAPLFIQCKRGGRIPKAEIYQLNYEAAKAGARPVLAVKARPGFRLLDPSLDPPQELSGLSL